MKKYLSILIIVVFSLVINACLENNMDAIKMIETADSLFKSRKYEEARTAYTELSEYALKNELTSELTEGYAMIARSDLIQGRKEEGRAFIKKCIYFYRKFIFF